MFIKNLFKILTFKIIFLSYFATIAQKDIENFNENIKGFFNKDSIQIGDHLYYIVFFKHPTDMELIFPDSSFNFKPFEYVDKIFFPTITDSLGSLDSVIYILTTFEVDKVQKLQIPIFVRNEKENRIDTLLSSPDSVRLIEVVSPSELNLENIRANTSWALVKKNFDYLYLSVIILIISFILIIIGLVFGKKIRKFYRLRKLRKQNIRFILDFEKLIYGNIDNQVIEEAIYKWKRHTGSLTGLLLVAYTTREINKILPETSLNKALKLIDMAIYANIHIEREEIKKQLILLKEYVLKTFKDKIKEIQNG